MSDGADRTEDASRILVWGTPRTTGRGGHMKIASIRTQSVSGRNSRRAMNAELEIGQPKIGYLRRLTGPVIPWVSPKQGFNRDYRDLLWSKVIYIYGPAGFSRTSGLPQPAPNWPNQALRTALLFQRIHQNAPLLHISKEFGVTQVVVPKLCREFILKLAHDIHLAGKGVEKTKDRILQHFYWQGIFAVWLPIVDPVQNVRRLPSRGRVKLPNLARYPSLQSHSRGLVWISSENWIGLPEEMHMF